MQSMPLSSITISIEKIGTKYFDFYERDGWWGIHNISENTLGFKSLLADNGKGLYRITPLD